MKITFDLSLFVDAPKKALRVGEGTEKGLRRQESEKALLWLLESLININRMELRANKIPPLYNAGVKYVREPVGEENWRDVVSIYRDGFGDCEDLSCWRIAELRNNNKRCEPYIRWRVDPSNNMLIYHVMVLRTGEVLEDPSKILGMKGIDQ